MWFSPGYSLLGEAQEELSSPTQNKLLCNICLQEEETDVGKVPVMGEDVFQSYFSLSNLHFPNVLYAVFDETCQRRIT